MKRHINWIRTCVLILIVFGCASNEASNNRPRAVPEKPAVAEKPAVESTKDALSLLQQRLIDEKLAVPEKPAVEAINNLFSDEEILTMAGMDAEISAMAALGKMDEALSEPLYTGDGGRDIRLAVLAPELQEADPGDKWLSDYAQGFLHSTLGKYSAMTLFDRQHLDQIIKEQDLAANMRFSDEDFIKIGNLTNVQYFLTGSLLKLPSKEFAVSLSISEASSGISRASFMQNGTAEAVQDGTLLNTAVESLLSQMNIALTDTGRRSLTSGRYMTARAETGYARGMAAEASGAAVEALLNFSQAVAFDPSRLEALSRLGSVSSEISGGSVSANILNDVMARRAWLDAMKEAATFFNSHPPFEITYDPNLIQIGKTDYVNERANLAMRISLMPSEASFAALNTLIEGLEKTGMREDWGFAGWPLLDIAPKTPATVLFPNQRSFSFTVQAALVNETSKVIARGNVKLEVRAIDFKAGDTSVSAPMGVYNQISFPNVNVNDLSPTLTVVIAGINDLSARQISDTGYMRIAPGDVPPPLSLESFVFVEGGTFSMGSKNGDASEQPVHQVTVSSFYLGKYEVTQEEWQEVMGNNPSDWKGDNLPVECVSWFDAVEYCNKRSVKEGLEPAYTINGDTVTWKQNANGYRLPTEAEWEFAAKGGGWDNPVFTYSGSNSVDSVAWYEDNSGEKTHPVGTKQPNSLGLYDMSGNVWEWCWDWYGVYAADSQINPSGAAAGSKRMIRGGSWARTTLRARSAQRASEPPSNRYSDVGFRLVRSDVARQPSPVAGLDAATTAPPPSVVSFVFVEGGTFSMGSESWYADEQPVHQVTVSSFYLGKYEVTQKEWQEVMGNNPSNWKGDNLPVESVSWFDAVEYCNKRSVKEGLEPAYTINGNTVTWKQNANGYRLPTEAEWEFAAKGGGRDNLVFTYSGSNSVDSVAWYYGNSGEKTHPVGTKQPNSLGLYDMSGNVFEWCWDWYGAYTTDSQINPSGAAADSYRVGRGGSWLNPTHVVRSVFRESDAPSNRYSLLGFRLVRS